MAGEEDEKEVWNVSNELVNVSNEWEIKDGNCEDTEAETDDWNGEAEKMPVTSRRELISFIHNIFADICFLSYL
jgi:hypothetical protein